MADDIVLKRSGHLGLSALFLTALLALLPAACGPEQDPVVTHVQAGPAATQNAG